MNFYVVTESVVFIIVVAAVIIKCMLCQGLNPQFYTCEAFVDN